jgi:hypothetical protein
VVVNQEYKGKRSSNGQNRSIIVISRWLIVMLAWQGKRSLFLLYSSLRALYRSNQELLEALKTDPNHQDFLDAVEENWISWQWTNAN